MSASVISVKTKENNAAVVNIWVMADGERKKYTVNEGTYREIGCPLSGDTLDEDRLALLSSADGMRRALAKALSLLSYADNGEGAIYRKLRRAGFSDAEATFAKEECVRLGYINEERQIESALLSSFSRLEGPYKVMRRLMGRGYTAKKVLNIIHALEDSGKIDYKAARQALLRDKLPEGSTDDEKRKLLQRYGYIK